MPADEQLFRRMIDEAFDYAIFSMDPDAVITSWSRGAERIFKLPADEAIGQNARIIFTPEDEVAGEADREICIAATEGRAEDDRWHVRPDGSRFWASGVLTAMRGEDGVIDGFVKIVRNKTDEKRMEESLRASEEQFARVFLANPAAMAIERRDTGAFVLANDSFFQLIGYWRAETMGRSGSALKLWAHPNERREALAKLDSEARSDNLTIHLRAKSGELRRCALALATTQLNGHDCLVMTLVEQES